MSPRDTQYLGSRLRDWMWPAVCEALFEAGMGGMLVGVLLDPPERMTSGWQIAGWVMVVAVLVHAALQPFIAYHDWRTFRALFEPRTPIDPPAEDAP